MSDHYIQNRFCAFYDVVNCTSRNPKLWALHKIKSIFFFRRKMLQDKGIRTTVYKVLLLSNNTATNELAINYTATEGVALRVHATICAAAVSHHATT